MRVIIKRYPLLIDAVMAGLVAIGAKIAAGCGKSTLFGYGLLGVLARLRFQPRMECVSLASPSSDGWTDIVARLGGRDAIAACARDHGAFQRRRGIKSTEDLLRLILAYGPGGRSLRATAAEAAARGIADVSDVALLDRFRNCADWLTVLCGGCWLGAIRRAKPGSRGRFG